MKKLKWYVQLGFALLVVGIMLSFAVPAFAQPRSDVGFKPNLNGKVDRVAIPVNLAVESWTLTASGTASPLGNFNYTSNVRVHMGLDGTPLSLTDGVGAFIGLDNSGKPNGDAIYFTLSGIFLPPQNGNPNIYPFEAVFIVTGGSGQFAGAVGSGRIQASADVQHSTFVGAWDGITRTLGG